MDDRLPHKGFIHNPDTRNRSFPVDKHEKLKLKWNPTSRNLKTLTAIKKRFRTPGASYNTKSRFHVGILVQKE